MRGTDKRSGELFFSIHQEKQKDHPLRGLATADNLLLTMSL